MRPPALLEEDCQAGVRAEEDPAPDQAGVRPPALPAVLDQAGVRPPLGTPLPAGVWLPVLKSVAGVREGRKVTELVWGAPVPRPRPREVAKRL